MSAAINTGGPAFPGVQYQAPAGGGVHIMTIVGGMTLRDYFAAKAMQGLLAQSQGTAIASPVEVAADYAYAMANAMLAVRDGSAAPILRRLFDLPLGSRFRYQGKPTVYVLLSYADFGLVGDNPTNGGLRRPFQGLYSAAESRAEFEALMVEFVPVVEATGQQGGAA